MSDGVSQPAIAPVQGRVLLIARLTWWIVAGLMVLMTLLAIPLNLANLRTVCTQGACNTRGLAESLSPAQIQGLSDLGISVDNYATYVVIVNLLPPVVYLVVALILFLRKPNDSMAYFTSLSLILFGGVTYPDFIQQLASSSPGWSIPYIVLTYLGSIFLVAFFYVFPTGHFVPRWMRFVLVVWAVEEVFDVISGPPLNLRLVPEWVLNGSFVLILLTSLYAQVYRYRRVSSAFQRQQTKWVVFAVIIALSTLLLSALAVFSRIIQTEHVLALLILNTLVVLVIVFIPVSIGIAILRSHLYDIDLLINRTLVYGTVTAILAGIFAATSSVMEKVFLGVTGVTSQQSDAATVLSTLLVVASFEPIKKRVQTFVDARFKYSMRAFGEFGEKLREFVELSDPPALLGRFLREALATFDAQSGAVYLGRDAQLELVLRIGAQDADAALSVPLEYESQQVGLITLGARKDGEPYADDDRRNLEQMGQLVARTIRLNRNSQPG